MCQLLSLMSGKRLLTINCHMHTEASDFLGGLRPVRRTSEEVGFCALEEDCSFTCIMCAFLTLVVTKAILHVFAVL